MGNFTKIFHTLDNLILSNSDLSHFIQGNVTLGSFARGNLWEIMCYFTMIISIPDNLALSNVTLSDSMWGNFTLGILPWVKTWVNFLDSSLFGFFITVQFCYLK